VSSLYRSPWRIDITVRPSVTRPLPLRLGRLGDAVAAALDAAAAPQAASVGLILADDVELAGLNAEHLGHEGPTDVLSFPLLPPEAFPAHPGGRERGPDAAPSSAASFAGPPGRRIHLGDVVVSVERAAEQAQEGRGGQTGDVRWPVAAELRLLATHGTLHLCGWDHAEPDEEREMRALEQRLLTP
jgi:probable rRNA maturation factor